ncbi:MAG: hypothetical protein AMS22_06955 [Thiotrichales bacterium SG8_50]|nr:MAG: hypothetical protein AMS22_06955 [Thiotrichales bacterium SG8_50]
MDAFEGLFFVFIILIFGVVYFLPTIVASNRDHPNTGWIFVFNLFIAGTILGWLILLFWASSSDKPEKVDR